MEIKFYDHLCLCGNLIVVKPHHKNSGIPKACKAGHSRLSHSRLSRKQKFNTRLQQENRVYEENKEYFCICGCGQLITIKDHHKYDGVSRYISGHNPGHPCINEHKQKLSFLKKGIQRTDEEKAAISTGTKLGMTEEVRKRISESRKGKGHSHTEESKKKMSKLKLLNNSWKGKTHTEEQKNSWKEQRRGINNPNFGNHLPEESKRKIGESNRESAKIRFYSRLLTSDRLKGLVKPLFNLEEFNGGSRKNKYQFQCLKCQNIFKDHLADGKIPRCYTCFPIQTLTYISKYEDELFLWIQSLGIQNIIKNSRSIIPPRELDIYLPEYNLAIEFNGLWAHSENAGKKDKNYHLNKTNLCLSKGIQLLHIFEDEWIEKQEIVKSIIRNRLGLIEDKIYARECEVKVVNNKIAHSFLLDNHLQEPINSKHNFGLYHENELVYLIALSKPRFNKNYEFELIRSCSKINTSIIGGFSKLLDYSKYVLNFKSLISYVDKRYFTGKGYQNNWKLINETSPNYYYTKDYLSRESRIKYQKHKLLQNSNNTKEDKKLTEWELMQFKNFDRIWDVGNKVYKLDSIAV